MKEWRRRREGEGGRTRGGRGGGQGGGLQYIVLPDKKFLYHQLQKEKQKTKPEQDHSSEVSHTWTDPPAVKGG